MTTAGEIGKESEERDEKSRSKGTDSQTKICMHNPPTSDPTTLSNRTEQKKQKNGIGILILGSV